MSRTKVKKQTLHAIDRIRERIGMQDKEEIEQFIRAASKRGLSWKYVEDPELQRYLFLKQSGGHKRVRYYKGYIFVFSKTSNKCITAYKAPEFKNDGENNHGDDKSDNA